MEMAPELEIEEETLRLAGLGDRLNDTKNKTKTTYSDRALILRFPVPLLRARGTLTPLDD